MRGTAGRTGARVALVVSVAFAALALAVMLAAPAMAQRDPYGGGEPTTIPTQIDQGPEVGGQEQEVQPGTLPFTGADVTLFVITGAAAIGTGGLILRRTRSRKSE